MQRMPGDKNGSVMCHKNASSDCVRLTIRTEDVFSLDGWPCRLESGDMSIDIPVEYAFSVAEMIRRVAASKNENKRVGQVVRQIAEESEEFCAN